MSIDICPTPKTTTTWTRFLDLPTRVKVIVTGLVAVALIAVGMAMAPGGSATADTSPSADAVAHEAIVQSALDSAWTEQPASSRLAMCTAANGSTGYRAVAARIATGAEGTVTTGEVVTFLHAKC